MLRRAFTVIILVFPKSIQKLAHHKDTRSLVPRCSFCALIPSLLLLIARAQKEEARKITCLKKKRARFVRLRRGRVLPIRLANA